MAEKKKEDRRENFQPNLIISFMTGVDKGERRRERERELQHMFFSAARSNRTVEQKKKLFHTPPSPSKKRNFPTDLSVKFVRH